MNKFLHLTNVNIYLPLARTIDEGNAKIIERQYDNFFSIKEFRSNLTQKHWTKVEVPINRVETFFYY